ncbi:MAG TPA: AraC family transcriptional regulator, partial [Polyangiaceae bacterium]|nr:AraC family transcriptional regulator [Polyangiaceae bacterium]
MPAWHGLLAPVVANAFDDLRVGVALRVPLGRPPGNDFWYPIHGVPAVSTFELEHGVGGRRWAYNARCFAEVERTRKGVLGEHAGFKDLFVPVLDASGVHGILVTGPFALTRPNSSDLLERWHEITGKQGRVGDPRFVDYVSATLSTLTLQGRSFEAFERMLACFAGLVGDGLDAEGLFGEAQRIRNELAKIRLPERMWEAARHMLDERTSGTWALQGEAVLHDMGMEKLPGHVVVGLLRGRDREPDPVNDLLERDAFQRACAELAQSLGGVGCGQVGNHGVVFLVENTGSEARTRRALSDLASRAANLARRFDLKLHAGISHTAGEALPLPGRYRAALWAAEKALSQGTSVAYGQPRPMRSGEVLRELRAEIGQSMRQRPGLLSPRFERYTEAVLAHCGYRLERARGELEAGLERLTEPLLLAGMLDRKSHSEMFAAMEERSESARTVMELVSSYRTLVADIQGALKDPTTARQDRGTRRALSYMQEHLAEPLSVGQLARVAGFAPDYFTRLFKRDEGVTPERYLQRLRIERASGMLRDTKLNLDSIRKLCGFQTRNYFHRLFRRSTGMTPIEYR